MPRTNLFSRPKMSARLNGHEPQEVPATMKYLNLLRQRRSNSYDAAASAPPPQARPLSSPSSPHPSSPEYRSAPDAAHDFDGGGAHSRPQSFSAGTSHTRATAGRDGSSRRTAPVPSRLTKQLSTLDSHQFVEHFRIGEPVEEKVRVIVGNETTTGRQASYILSGKLLCDHSPYFANTIGKAHFDGTVILDHISSKDFDTNRLQECIIHYLYMKDFQLPRHPNGAAQLQQLIDFGCVSGELRILHLLDDVALRIRELLAEDRQALGSSHLEYAGAPVATAYFPQLLPMLMDIWVENELTRMVRRWRSAINDDESRGRVLDCFEQRLTARVEAFKHAGVPNS